MVLHDGTKQDLRGTYTNTTTTPTIAIVRWPEGCNKDIDTIMILEATPLPLVSLQEDSSREGKRRHGLDS